MPPFGPPGPGRRPDRLFEKGDLKYLILDLLREKARHGYDVMRALEGRFGGFYTPSPGAIYPTLQLLEDLGYVTATQHDGKKIYAITEAGRTFLREREEQLAEIGSRLRGVWGDAGSVESARVWAAVKDELAEIARLLRRVGAPADPRTLERVVDTLRRARLEVEGIVRDRGTVAL
jgi:DNA-binding PadR family transcriptional regulator